MSARCIAAGCSKTGVFANLKKIMYCFNFEGMCFACAKRHYLVLALHAIHHASIDVTNSALSVGLIFKFVNNMKTYFFLTLVNCLFYSTHQNTYFSDKSFILTKYHFQVTLSLSLPKLQFVCLKLLLAGPGFGDN